jgi:hypothetical protein
VTDNTPQSPITTPADADEKTRVERARNRLDPVGNGTPIHGPSTKMVHSSYQDYLFRSAGSKGKPAWSDSAGGRAIIRLFSRGILGAAAFTVGGRIARTQMLNYSPETFEWAAFKDRPLQGIAKIFDETLGKSISWVAYHTTNTRGLTEAEALLAKENRAWNSVNFRTKGYFHTVGGKLLHGQQMNGRSLGSEMVGITFDFAMASIGDAVGRNMVQMVDPNVRKSWLLNDQGKIAADGEKSHFNLKRFVESTGVAAWRVISKNQGEDWFAALPYVYQMKAQRGLISNAFEHDLKGVKLVFDNQWNGGAYKVNNEGKIVGDYQLAGAVDLHARFVGYNVYTLMFREGYDWIGEHLKSWRNKGYPMHVRLPEHFNPIGATYHGVRNTLRYVTKSFIKANLYMNPAVIPFWIMRAPQTKWRGAMINAEAGLGQNAIGSVMSFDERVHIAQEAWPGLSFDEMKARMTNPEEPSILNYSTTKRRVYPGWQSPPGQNPALKLATQPEFMYFGNQQVRNPLYGMNGPHDSRTYEHYEPGFSTWFSKALNPFGKFSYWLGGKAANWAHDLPEGKLKKFIGMDEGTLLGPHPERKPSAGGRETFMRNFVDASLSYTPYMYAKAEFGLLVDDRAAEGGLGKMDKAIYKLIDNVSGFHFRQAGKTVKEIWHLSTHSHDTLPTPSDSQSITNPPTFGAPTSTAPVRPIPTTIVHAEGRERQHAIGTPAPVATVADAAPDSERNWAESVAGRDLSAQFQATTPTTRH